MQEPNIYVRFWISRRAESNISLSVDVITFFIFSSIWVISWRRDDADIYWIFVDCKSFLYRCWNDGHFYGGTWTEAGGGCGWTSNSERLISLRKDI